MNLKPFDDDVHRFCLLTFLLGYMEPTDDTDAVIAFAPISLENGEKLSIMSNRAYVNSCLVDVDQAVARKPVLYEMVKMCVPCRDPGVLSVYESTPLFWVNREEKNAPCFRVQVVRNRKWYMAFLGALAAEIIRYKVPVHVKDIYFDVELGAFRPSPMRASPLTVVLEYAELLDNPYLLSGRDAWRLARVWRDTFTPDDLRTVLHAVNTARRKRGVLPLELRLQTKQTDRVFLVEF